MDKKFTYNVASNCKNAQVMIDISPNEFIELLQNAEFSIGMRLHTMVLSLVCLTPHISIPYDKKCLDMHSNVLRAAKEIGVNADEFLLCAPNINNTNEITSIDKSKSQIKMQKLVEKLRFEAANFKNYIENLTHM